MKYLTLYFCLLATAPRESLTGKRYRWYDAFRWAWLWTCYSFEKGREYKRLNP